MKIHCHNFEPSDKFNVNEKQIRDWAQNHHVLKSENAKENDGYRN